MQIVNFVQATALNPRIFHNMCEEMESQNQDLLFRSNVRWLSRGNILTRTLELKFETEIFLYEKRHALADCLNDAAWPAKLAYLRDIFTHLNERNSDMVEITPWWVLVKKIVSFKKKLALWRRSSEESSGINGQLYSTKC